MRFELEWLKSWVAVVDSGGFARAGTRIHLSQPRVSAHVAQLEIELGCQLIDRRGRPLALTEEGERFLPRARAILAAVDDAVSEVRSERKGITGRLTIASFASASAEYLPALLANLRSSHPALEVAIIDADLRGIESFLAQRHAEVAIRPFRPSPNDHRLGFRPLWREQFVVLAPHGHPVLAQANVSLEQVLAHPMITIGDPLAHHTLGEEVWAVLRSSRLQPQGGLVAHQPTTLAALVRAGHGIGLVNQLAASMVRTDGLETRPIANDQLYRDVGIWWRTDRPMSRAAQAFIDAAAHTARPLGTSALSAAPRPELPNVVPIRAAS
jgi:DNA-binding transcriptional LysR family regulator